MTRDELLAGLRRFGLLSMAIVVITAAGSLALGALTGTGLRRSLSLGFYVAGVGCIVLGLFQAVRPPVRNEPQPGAIERCCNAAVGPRLLERIRHRDRRDGAGRVCKCR